MPKRSLMAVTLAAISAAPVLADQVVFKNGDTLTGKIESAEAGKLTIADTVAGKVTVELSKVKTFQTDKPIAMKLQDGTILHEKMAPAAEGEVAVAPGAAAPRNVPLAQVKYINFPDRWTGNVVAGGTLVRGNTNTDTFNATAHALRRWEKDRITLDAGFLYGRQKVPGDGKHETANDWWVSGKWDHFFTPKFYSYVNNRVERDVIAGIDLRLTPGAGLGYQWYDRPDFHLSTEAGASWLYRNYSNDGSDNTAALRFAYHVDKKLNKQVSFFHDFEYFPGLQDLNNYYFDTDAGVRANVTDHMFTEFKVLYKYESRPAPGKGSNDQQFILGVGWNF